MEYKNYTCPKCKITPAASQFENEKEPKCDDCKIKLTIKPETNPDAIIEIADQYLEDANRHDIDATHINISKRI